MTGKVADVHLRAIRLWLCAVAALVFAMVLVGGATRLTESGLSITEWKPVVGALPPLGRAQWQAEFDRYKAIPQYRELNSGMSLAQFKTIFWWEWTHRLLGRLIGVAFLLPFLWFLWRGCVRARLGAQLWLIFGLGALQGAVGWWMVASGLVDRVEVSQYRLATHLALAATIYVALVWTVQRLDGRPRAGEGVGGRMRASAVALLILVLVQLYLGALVAGLRAGYIYNTWPLIDGGFVPPASALFSAQPWWRNLFENALTVQFDHRMLAYAIWLCMLLHLFDAMRSSEDGAARRGALVLFAAVSAQAALGIATLVLRVPIAVALLHQAMAMLVLTAATVHAARLVEGAPRAVAAPAPA